MARPAEEDELAADAALWGIPAEALEDAREDEEGLWPEHEAAVLAFLSVQTQWRAAPVGDGGLCWLGLDYQGAQAAWRLAGEEITPDLWTQVQLIEAGALAALNGGRS